MVFTIALICAMGATTYVLWIFRNDQQGVIFGVLLIGGPMAAGLLCAGALAGSWARRFAGEAKIHYSLLISAVILGSAGFFVFNSGQQEKTSIAEKRLAAEFVKNNKAIIQEAGKDSAVGLHLTKMKNGTVVSYEFSVRGMKRLYVIVDVSRQGGDPLFTLACISPLDIGENDLEKVHCRK